MLTIPKHKAIEVVLLSPINPKNRIHIMRLLHKSYGTLYALPYDILAYRLDFVAQDERLSLRIDVSKYLQTIHVEMG